MGSKKPSSKGKAPKKAHKPQGKREKQKTEEKENFRGIIRLAGKDIVGHTKLRQALLRVRGISHSLSASVAKALEAKLGIAPTMKVGDLTDEQIEKIDKILFSLNDHNIPKFMLNRQGDLNTGNDLHVIMNDLIIADRDSVENEKKLFTWKGYRHGYGQRVRGQRTRNTGRSGMAVGVLRKAVIAAQGGGDKAKAGAAPAAKGKGDKK